MKKSKIRNGFTLIELLVVITVFVSVGVVIGNILFSALRGTNRTNTLTVVKQNGSFAIAQMTKMTRNAKSFEGISTDGSTYITDCTVVIPPAPTPTPVPIKYYYVKITNFDETQTIFSCYETPLTPLVTPTIKLTSNFNAKLVDVDNQVAITDCSFTCTQGSISDFPTITINFSLTQKETNVVPERIISPIPFQTSVTIRNVGR